MALRQHTTQFFLWQIRLSSEATPFQLRDKSAFPPKQRLFNSVKNPPFSSNSIFPILQLIRFRSTKTHLENERVARRENMSVSFANRRMLSLRQNKRSVFSRTCAGKRHLKSRERGDENEVYGEKTE